MDPTATPIAVDLAGATSILTDLGILPVVTVVAVIILATLVYKRFRR